MSLLNILHHPDPRLRKKAAPVSVFDNALATLADNMLETMYAAPGIGLAATQVNVHKRLIVVDVSENQDTPHVLVNPKLELVGDKVTGDEGCLSVPGFYERVARAARINVQAQDVTGAALALGAEGLLAICIQHECDHLEGKLFVDYLSSLKRNRINKQLRQLAAERG
jgi:peptide deformylase